MQAILSKALITEDRIREQLKQSRLVSITEVNGVTNICHVNDVSCGTMYVVTLRDKAVGIAIGGIYELAFLDAKDLFLELQMREMKIRGLVSAAEHVCKVSDTLKKMIV